MLHVKTGVVQELGNVAQEHSGVVLGLGNLVQDWGSTGLSTYFWMIACSYWQKLQFSNTEWIYTNKDKIFGKYLSFIILSLE